MGQDFLPFFFFLRLNNIPFIFSFVSGHLECFHLQAVVNKVTVNLAPSHKWGGLGPAKLVHSQKMGDISLSDA